MARHSVSVQIVQVDDVGRLIDLLGLQSSDVYQATFTSSDTNGHRHATRALGHIARRKQEATDDATVIFFACHSDARRREWSAAYRWARYVCVVLKNQAGAVPGSVSLVQTGDSQFYKASLPTVSIQAAARLQWTSSLTFSWSTESFAGMYVNGHKRTSGYTRENLDRVKLSFATAGYIVEDIALGTQSGTGREARVLVVRGALLGEEVGLADAVVADLEQVVHPQTDTQALMRGKLLNRIARYCACLGEKPVAADLANGVGVVIPFNTVPAIEALRLRLGVIPETRNLLAEVNYYYDADKGYIGFHGDSERPDVLGCVVGRSKALAFQGFCRARPTGERVILELEHGDLYIGCEVAFGHHWKKERCRSDCIHYRHAAYQTGNPIIKSNAQIHLAVDKKDTRRQSAQARK